MTKRTYFHNKNILIISPEPWDHLFVSKHHYAIELQQDNRIFFLNPPGKENVLRPTRFKNINEITYKSFVKGLRFLPGFWQRAILKKKFHELEAMAKVQFDCVWSFDNSVFFDFSIFPDHVLKIQHIVDLSQNFQLPTAARTAQLCMGVSQPIVDLLKLYNPNTFLMPHGIAIGRTQDIDVTLPGNNKVKAIFAGNLDRKHFDKEILLRLAVSHPDIDFIFYGPGGADWKRLPNTFYPGVVESEHLLSYLRKADVLLLPYKFGEFPKELTNSHKVLDYLRSGNVIVSSYLEDYAGKEELITMAHNASEFEMAFSRVVKELGMHNNEENMEIRRAYASQHSYATRVMEIEALIQKVTSQ